MTTKKMSIVILCVIIVSAVGAYTFFGQSSPKTRLVSALENSDCYLTENEIKATFNTAGDTWGVMEPFAEELIRSGEIEMQGSTVVLMDRGSCISPTEAFVEQLILANCELNDRTWSTFLDYLDDNYGRDAQEEAIKDVAWRDGKILSANYGVGFAFTLIDEAICN